MLEPEDEPAAEAADVDALPAVSYDAPDWGTLDALDDLDVPPPIAVGGFEPDEDDRRWAAETFAEPEPFVRSAEDRAEMRAPFDRVDQVEARYMCE
jgi:hypothetical protein